MKSEGRPPGAAPGPPSAGAAPGPPSAGAAPGRPSAGHPPEPERPAGEGGAGGEAGDGREGGADGETGETGEVAGTGADGKAGEVGKVTGSGADGKAGAEEKESGADGETGADGEDEQRRGGFPEGAAPEDMVRPEARKQTVVQSVRARASFVGTTNIQNVVIGAEGHRSWVPLTDLVALHGSSPFVAPPGYPALDQAIGGSRVIACLGPDGCGKERAITHALVERGLKDVRLLPAGLDLAQVCRVVETAAGDGGACVVPALSESMFRALAGPPGQPIRAIASSRRITVVITSALPADAAARRAFDVANLDYPDASAVSDACLSRRDAPPAVRDLARKTLDELDPPLSPAVVVAVVDEAAGHPDGEPAAIAAMFNNALSTESLQNWIGEGRCPQDVSLMAAGATLSGAPAAVVQAQAQNLLHCLRPSEPSEQSPLLLSARSPWPAGLLQTAMANVSTHFGIQPLDIAEVVEPHRPQDIVQALWRMLGPEFQSRYCLWLTSLPGRRQLRWHAAYTAGALFAVDPVLIEAQVLRPWAMSQDSARRQCAGLALGTPIATGADPSNARTLAHAWSTSSSVALRHAAVAAYGGLLGAWDAASAAPWKLLIIGQSTPELRRESDLALASLLIAGPEAAASRAWLIGYLKLVAEDRMWQSRIFGCLPLMVGALVSPNKVCTESLAAMRAEPRSWAGLNALIATALVTPRGVADGRRCLFLFIHAAAAGHFDHEILGDLLRGMKDSQREWGRVGRLGSVVRRSLAAFTRSGDETVKHIAGELTKSFFN